MRWNSCNAKNFNRTLNRSLITKIFNARNWKAITNHWTTRHSWKDSFFEFEETSTKICSTLGHPVFVDLKTSGFIAVHPVIGRPHLRAPNSSFLHHRSFFPLSFSALQSRITPSSSSSSVAKPARRALP